jgi:Methyltransferase domain
VEGYDESTYGDAIADVYDDWYLQRFDVDQTVEFLADLAGGGPALELAIGTGRIALPLADRGVNVAGVDASERMVAKLRDKPGGGAIPVTMGTFADVPVDGMFRLIYIPFTTLFALSSQAEQIRCFRNVAAHLEPNGYFALDAFVPDLRRFHSNQTVSVPEIRIDSVVLDVSRHDPVEQRIDSSHLLVTAEGVRLFPVSIRYAWPAELDVMAMHAGLHCIGRWADYDRSPFTADSPRHVSVYSS